MRLKSVILPFLDIALVLLTTPLYIIAFLNRGLIKVYFSRGGYYLILALVLCWVIAILQCFCYYKPNVKSFIKKYALGLALSLIISIIVFISVEPMFRVLSDETNLLAVSKSMVYEKRTDNVTMGMRYYDNFYPINREAPKRPLLFPFFTNIMHTLVGYRAENAFVVNFLALWALLFLIYAQFKRYLGDTRWASAAVFLVASQPLVIQTATSAGFDLLSVLFLVISFVCLKMFLDKQDAASFQLMWVNLLMLANVRYEGVMFLAIIILLLACFRYIRYRYFTTGTNFVYFFTPLVLVLGYWQKFLIANQFETKDAAFALKYLVKNSAVFLKNIFNFGFYLPYAAIINIIGLAALIYLGYLFIAGRLVKENKNKHFIIISAVCLFANWVLFASFYMGRPDHPSESRLFTIFCVLLSVLAAVLLNNIKSLKERAVPVLVFSMVLFALYHPVSVEDRFSRTQILPREYRFTVDFLKKESLKSKSFLIISDRPGQYAVWNYGAVNFDYANKNKSIAEGYRNHLYENIFVIQDIDYKMMKPKEGDRLNDEFVLEKVTESQNDSDRFTRISKVVSIMPGKPSSK